MHNDLELRVLSPTDLTISTSIYAAGDLVGNKMTFSGASNLKSAAGTIRGLVLSDLAKQSAVLTLILFSSDPSATTFTDNAALDIADVDLPKVIGKVNIVAADYVALSDNSVACIDNLYVKYQVGNGATPDSISSALLYGAFILVSGTPTYAATTDLSLKLKIEMD